MVRRVALGSSLLLLLGLLGLLVWRLWSGATGAPSIGGDDEVPVAARDGAGLGGYADGDGVRIDAIAPGSRGDRSGLELRDRVFPLDGAPIDDVMAWADQPGPLHVQVERHGQVFETTL